MLLIPAIDLKDGRCVRLRQGRMDEVTVFSDDPVGVAKGWAEAGARRIHIVDLDGASAGRPRNGEVIRRIVEAVPGTPIQVGGGIRDEDTVQEYLITGARYVILGTKAVTAPHFVADICAEFPGRILVGLDAHDGKVAIDGWSKLSNHDVVDLAQHFEQDGVDAIIYTDISRDGTLAGVNVEATVKLASSLTIPVFASGGISSLDDIRALCAVADQGVAGAITGRAIDDGSLDFSEANRLAIELGGEDAWDSPSE
jgi:phosphoribosylformimino-5-aminoimidazole carboxamide ribotide isomerase